MYYENVPDTFFTNAPDNVGTSKYYVVSNGTIRAKVADNTLRVRPGKNMMFVTNDGAEAVLDSGVQRVNLAPQNAMAIVLITGEIVPASKVSTLEYNNPVDMYLTDAGVYDGGQHVGDTITGAYNAGDSGITEAECDAAEGVYITDHEINVHDDVTVPIVGSPPA